MKTSNININDIPLATALTGYVWLSDESEPRIFERQPFDSGLAALTNPFIIEGLLYCEEEKVSYYLKYVDGHTHVYRYELCVQDFRDNETKEFFGNRMGQRKLRFLEVWEPQPDELCNNMEVLQFQANVFVGFNNE